MGIKFRKKQRCVPSQCDSTGAQRPKQSTKKWLRIISLFAEKQNRPAPSKQAARALGGKYLSKKATSLRSMGTEEITERSESWKSCRSRDYLTRSQPLSFEEQKKVWEQAIHDARRLPRTAHFSNHIMVNLERTKRTIPALKRSSELDAVARWWADNMAKDEIVRHSDARELETMMKMMGISYTDLGENVAVGESVRSIHDEMVHNSDSIRNMTDREFQQFGMATSRGKNGELYLCQIFSGNNN